MERFLGRVLELSSIFRSHMFTVQATKDRSPGRLSSAGPHARSHNGSEGGRALTRRHCKPTNTTQPRILQLIFFITILFGCDRACAQMVQPFEGQGDEPANTTTVYVSAFLERLLHVDDKAFKFTAKFVVYMNWVDPRAHRLIRNRTQEVREGTGPDCERVCDGPRHGRSSWQACCDTIWLPDFRLANVEEIPEGHVNNEEIGVVGPDSEIVTWFATVQGTFYTDMNVLDYPFDEQELSVQLLLDTQGSDTPKVVLQASASGETRGIQADFTKHSSHDAHTEDWSVQYVAINITRANFPSDIIKSVTSPPNPSDPAPLLNSSTATSVFLFDPKAGADQLTETLDTTDSYRHGVVISIGVSRVASGHVLNIILPIMLCVWLASVVFFMETDNLNDRIGTVVTLFLALVAVQFVSQDILPSSAGTIATQQLVILTYLYLGLLGMESILVHHVSTAFERQKIIQQLDEAEQRAKQALVAKGLPEVKHSLPLGEISSRAKKRRSSCQFDGLAPADPESSLKSEGQPCAGSFCDRVPDVILEEPEKQGDAPPNQHSSGKMVGDSKSCFGKLGSTLWYLPRNIRNVEHYGSHVARHIDRLSLTVWLLSYHILVVVIFVTNEYMH